MSRYHHRTLALLGPEGKVSARPVPELIQWAKANGITLPAAYLEWAQLDGQAILYKYSNMDPFFFEEPEIITCPDGVRGLLFNVENQGNFNKIVLLDNGDDPPVRFAWIGKPPWVLHAASFSDSVYAQIFDWQYMVKDGDVQYYGAINLASDRCLSFLRTEFNEKVTTRIVIEERCSQEYRFLNSPNLRLTVSVSDQPQSSEEGLAHIVITGEHREIVATEAELLDALSDDVVPDSFSSPRMAMAELARAIDYRGPSVVRHMSVERANAEAVDRLMACHRQRPLVDRVSRDFPKEGDACYVGDGDWGVTIHFRQRNANWWWIQRIELIS